MKIKIFTILFITFSLYLVGNAQSDNENSQDTTKTYLSISESGNSLNGHRFISSSKIKSPFISTYLQTSLGSRKYKSFGYPDN